MWKLIVVTMWIFHSEAWIGIDDGPIVDVQTATYSNKSDCIKARWDMQEMVKIWKVQHPDFNYRITTMCKPL